MLSRVRKTLVERPVLAKVLGNSAWLASDRIVRMFLGLSVGVWVARYLGTQGFGQLNYALAFAGLFGPLATLGLDNAVVKELLHAPERGKVILGTALLLRLLGAVAALALSLGAAWKADGAQASELLMVGFVAGAFLFQSFDVFDSYFQARLQPARTVLARLGAAVLASGMRVALILNHVGVEAFAAVLLGEALLAALALYSSYRRDGGAVAEWSFDGAEARRLLALSWPLVLSGFAIMIYMRIDQIMLKHMASDSAVGIYAAAVKFSELWYFVPAAIVNASFPTILLAQHSDPEQFQRRLDRLFSGLVGLGLLVALGVTVLGPTVLSFLYGRDFGAAGPVLCVHIWAGISVALGLAKEYWLVSQGLTRFSFLTTLFGAVCNILLNLFMIPRWGAMGAAWATVISQVMANQVAPAFYRDTRPVFFMQWRGFLLWRAWR